MSGTCASPVESRPRLPEWLKKSLSPVRTSEFTTEVIAGLKLNTICQSGRCPNRNECFANRTASFMILGDRCTRRCHYCSVATRRPLPPDPAEAEHLVEAVRQLGLEHVVITSVTRDDLPDEGLSHFKRVTEALRAHSADLIIEILTPDFKRDQTAAVKALTQMPVHIFNHNIETVRSIHPKARPQGTYGGSLALLDAMDKTAGSKILIKSGAMLGLGETDREVLEMLGDLYRSGVRLLTLGQYLQPSKECWSVKRFVPPSEFDHWRDEALRMGFWVVESGPFVRSSYHAAASLTRLKSVLKAQAA